MSNTNTIDTPTAIANIANDEGVITDWQTMMLVNHGPVPFTIEYSMQKYILPANGSLQHGHYAVVPYHAFVLYCGDPRSFDVPGDDRQRYRSDEWKRLRCRYGVYDDVTDGTLNSNIPQLAAYTVHGDRVLTVLEDPEGFKTFGDDPRSSQAQAKRTNELMAKQIQELQAKMDNMLALQNQASVGQLVNPLAVDPEADNESRRADDDDRDISDEDQDDIPSDTPTSSANIKFS